MNKLNNITNLKKNDKNSFGKKIKTKNYKTEQIYYLTTISASLPISHLYITISS